MGQGVLEAIPAQEAGYTLDTSPVHHRVNRERQLFTRLFTKITQRHLPIFPELDFPGNSPHGQTAK